MIDYFQTLAGFNRWANARTFAAAATLSESDYRADRGAFFGSVHATLNHILLVDHVWFGRLGVPVPGPESRSLDQILHDDLPSLTQGRRVMDDVIVGAVDRLSDADLVRTVVFRTTKGAEYSQRIDLTLGTVFNHAIHHRGQVHALLTQMGAEGPVLDLPAYLREVA